MDMAHAHLTVSVGEGAATAGTDTTDGTVWPYAQGGKLTALRFTPDRAVTAHDTNNCDISVEIDGTEVASEVTSTSDTGNLTAGGDIDLALTVSGASLEVSQWSTFVVKMTKAGTGVAIGGSVVGLFDFDRQGS